MIIVTAANTSIVSQPNPRKKTDALLGKNDQLDIRQYSHVELNQPSQLKYAYINVDSPQHERKPR